jgi:hypothetical protein
MLRKGSFKLSALNLFRWLRENILFWGILSLIYSLTVSLILQPILEHVFSRELRLGPLWFLTCALLIVPGILEALPLPALPLRQGLFRESIFLRPAGRLGQMYLRHDLRRGATWLTIVLTVAIGALLRMDRLALWALVVQLPLQRALYSLRSWRTAALLADPERGAAQLLGALELAQLIQLLITTLAFSLALMLPLPLALKLAGAGVGAVLSGACVAMEADAGVPWMVNFMSLAAGIIGGFCCWYSPWFLLVVLYLNRRMHVLVAERLYSVEHLDEDALVS